MFSDNFNIIVSSEEIIEPLSSIKSGNPSFIASNYLSSRRLSKIHFAPPLTYIVNGSTQNVVHVMGAGYGGSAETRHFSH